MNRIREIFLISILITVAGIGAVVFFVLNGQNGAEPLGSAIEETSSDEPPIIFIAIMVIIAIVSILPFLRIFFPVKIKNGEKATATVTKVWDTGTTINDDPQVGLRVNYVTKEGARCEADTKTLVSRLQVTLVQPGVSASILYDPKNTKRVQVIELETEGMRPESLEDRMELLTRLREKGLISEAEFQKKREEIIKAI